MEDIIREDIVMGHIVREDIIMEDITGEVILPAGRKDMLPSYVPTRPHEGPCKCTIYI